jgi:DNA-binding IclR family transcriptional regulator
MAVASATPMRFSEGTERWQSVALKSPARSCNGQGGEIMGVAEAGALADKEHRTVSRVAAILESAAITPDGVSLTDLARVLGAPKSSIHGLLRGLVAVGYLVERNSRYVTAPGLPALLTAAYVPSIEELARPVMTHLRDTFDESVMLGVLAADSIVYVDSVESRQPIRYSAPLHERRLLHPSSMGCLYARSSRRSGARRNASPGTRSRPP